MLRKTASFTSKRFLARGLFITLMMEAASTSETLVKLLPDYTALQPRRQPSYSSLFVEYRSLTCRCSRMTSSACRDTPLLHVPQHSRPFKYPLCKHKLQVCTGLGLGLVPKDNARVRLHFNDSNQILYTAPFSGHSFFAKRNSCLRSSYARDTAGRRKQIPPAPFSAGFSWLPSPRNSSISHLTNTASGIFVPFLKRQNNLRCF
jgi:hypothetical protein